MAKSNRKTPEQKDGSTDRSIAKGKVGVFKGGRITSQAPPKPQKPKGK